MFLTSYILHLKSRTIFYIPYTIFLLLLLLFPPSASAQTTADWYMSAANPQRTSWVSSEVRGPFKPVWYRPIDPYIDNKVQAIAANGSIYVATAKGLYAFDAASGNQRWVYGTELPLGNSPTYYNGTLYVGGFDHKLHAINAADGIKKWTSTEVGSGFTTNPLVVNDSYTGNVPVIFLGNRDGYFYAFDSTGVVKWKYQAEGPINYSASYKNGVVYFGDDDSYAYALNAASGSLVWKSAKFSGVGFDMYWPVIWTDTTVNPNKDYVIFTGSMKSAWMWFVGNSDMSHQDNFDMYKNVSGLCGATGTEPYLWASGTQTIKCDTIYNWYNDNAKWGGKPPWNRIVYVLDRLTGVEKTPYAPINPSPHDGGGQGYRQPPIVGADNVIYTFIGYRAGGNGGSTNGISGWKFGTPYISRLFDEFATGMDGAADEPRVLTSGGNIVYYGEGNNHQVWGAIEISKPIGSNAWWKWDTINVPGATSKYTKISLDGKFGGQNGSYSYFDGLLNFSPIPYNGKLYYIQGNILFALSSTGTASSPLSLSQTPANQISAGIATSASAVKSILESEVQKIIDVYTQQGKILRPGFHDSHHVGGSMVLPATYAPYYIPGSHLMEYFHNPSDTVYTLVEALPYLSSSLQSQVKTYLQNNFGPGKTYDVARIAHIGWQAGAKRESGDDTSEMTATLTNSNGLAFYLNLTPQTSITGQNERLNIGSFPPENFYGAWKFAQVFPTQAKTLFDAMKAKMPTPGTGNDMGYSGTSDTNSNFAKYPYLLNQYLAGYKGYLELEKLAGYTTDISQSTKYPQYQSLLALKVNTFNENVRWTEADEFINVLNTAGNFMFLVPEIHDYLRSSSKYTQIQQALNNSLIVEPYWFVSKYNRSFSESYSRPLYDYPALFQARAYILKQSFPELVKYLDVPAFERGDLFYIQNLTAALAASGNSPSTTPTPTSTAAKPGDANGDGKVDFIDYAIWRLHFGQTTANGAVDGDFNNSNYVDFVDYAIWRLNFGT